MSDRSDSLFRIKDLLGDVGSRLGLTSAVETGQVWSRWVEIVGDSVARHAEPSSLKGGVLRVRADSPSWASEIGYLKDEIRTAVNRAVGLELVKEIRVWSGPGSPRPPRSTPAPGARVSSPPEAARAVPSDPREALERARGAWARRRDRSDR
jgi:predicted nucleic acid-binding Zn ribbon protein